MKFDSRSDPSIPYLEERRQMFLWLACFVALAALLQFFMPYPLDDDTAYHYSVARLIAEHGPLQSFPWTRFSWQFDHYADKEFLFHLLFIPFTTLGFNNSSRIVGIICGSALLWVLYRILRAEQIRYAGVWAVLPLGMSIFVYRFAQVRPQLISISLAAIFLWACTRDRLWMLGVVSLLYPLAYVAFWQIPFIMLVAVELSRLMSGERLRWKPAVVALIGIATGLLLHPNAGNLMEMNWIHMSDVLFRNAWGARIEFNMGEEFDPFSLLEWIQYLAVPAGIATTALYVAWKRRLQSSAPLAFALAALFFGVLTMRSNRFLEYFVPLSVLAFAITSASFNRRNLVYVLLGLSLLLLLIFGTIPYENLRSMDARIWYMEPEVLKQLDSRIPPGSHVFTSGWEYTGSLLLNLPGRNYMVALDPTLMYKRDPALYNDWYRLLLDAPVNAADIVRKRFDSRYILCQNHEPLWPFFSALSADPSTTTVILSKKWLFFDLGR